MSDYLPLDIQVKIIKRLPVKSLLRCRSVSKAWKSLIDSADFIAHHSTRHAHSRCLTIRYEVEFVTEEDHLNDFEYEAFKDFVSFVDDDTFPEQKIEPIVPVPADLTHRSRIIGTSLGLLCWYRMPETFLGRSKGGRAVIWNPSIRKYVKIDVPNVLGGNYNTVLGFGVCPNTNDAKIVKVAYSMQMDRSGSSDWVPWQVEVFTLSSGNWRSLCSNIPRKSIKVMWSQVAIDGFIYWLASDWIAKDDGFQLRSMIMSFDMTTEEFIEVNLPDSLPFPRYNSNITMLSISKLRESLVVLGYTSRTTSQRQVCSVWEMKHGVQTSFTKLFNIEPPVESGWGVSGFSKSGKPVLSIHNDFSSSDLVVYEPSSKTIKHMLYGQQGSFFVDFYVETLLLLHVPIEDAN